MRVGFSHRIVRRGGTTRAPSAERLHGRYLTDGVHLFRALSEESGGQVWIEDCRSLEVLLASAPQIRAMRPVTPSAPAACRAS